MKFVRDIPAGGATRIIRGYDATSITTSDGSVLTSSSLIAADALAPWPPHAAAELTVEHVALLLAHEPEVLVIGTGARFALVPQAALAAARAKRIGVEVMDTAAACRTYNVLVSEGRRVVAGLML
jgi:uncharacterized protein